MILKKDIEFRTEWPIIVYVQRDVKIYPSRDDKTES